MRLGSGGTGAPRGSGPPLIASNSSPTTGTPSVGLLLREYYYYIKSYAGKSGNTCPGWSGACKPGQSL